MLRDGKHRPEFRLMASVRINPPRRRSAQTPLCRGAAIVLFSTALKEQPPQKIVEASTEMVKKLIQDYTCDTVFFFIMWLFSAAQKDMKVMKKRLLKDLFVHLDATHGVRVDAAENTSTYLRSRIH